MSFKNVKLISLNADSEIEDAKPIKKRLEWKRMDYTSAKQLFLFKMFSKRRFGKTTYRIGRKTPDDFEYTEITTVPINTTFEKASDIKFNYLRMMVANYYDPKCLMKLRKKAE